MWVLFDRLLLFFKEMIYLLKNGEKHMRYSFNIFLIRSI